MNLPSAVQALVLVLAVSGCVTAPSAPAAVAAPPGVGDEAIVDKTLALELPMNLSDGRHVCVRPVADACAGRTPLDEPSWNNTQLTFNGSLQRGTVELRWEPQSSFTEELELAVSVLCGGESRFTQRAAGEPPLLVEFDSTGADDCGLAVFVDTTTRHENPAFDASVSFEQATLLLLNVTFRRPLS